MESDSKSSSDVQAADVSNPVTSSTPNPLPGGPVTVIHDL